MRLPAYRRAGPCATAGRLPTALLAVILFTAASCKTTKKVPESPAEQKSATFLFTQMRSNELKYEWFSARASVSATVDKKDYTFNALLRARKDSVVWISVTSLLGIEVARFHISPDSVKFINRLAPAGSRYFTGPFSELERLLGLNFGLDFHFFQAILTGTYYPYYADSVFKASAHNKFYNIGTVNRRRLRKKYLVQEEDSMALIKQDIRLDPATWKIIRIDMNDLTNNRKFETTYDDFGDAGGQSFPHSLRMDINADKPAALRITFSRVGVDKAQTFPFKPPE